jgi:(R)-2-hydroxyacyl-CoA dehydratese activating ATPase
MKAIGIDAGSLTTKVVVIEDDEVVSSVIVQSGDETEAVARLALEKALPGFSPDGADAYIVCTGVGGKAITFGKQQKPITTCLARGIGRVLPSVRLLIDMGAETSTIIKLNERKKLTDWLGHDKCASGTGLFLGQMAKLLQMPLEQMAQLSLKAQAAADITSTCAVFAESEVISHVHRDPPTPTEQIIAGIHASVVSRLMALAKRIGIEKDVAVAGGVALNVGLVHILEKELGFAVLVPENPQTVGALGAAMIAAENIKGAPVK